MNMYIYMCICTCGYICMYIYAYVYIYTHIYIYIHTYIFMYIYENTFINIHTHMYVYIYTYIHIHTYMSIYKYMSSMPRMQYAKHLGKNKRFSNVSSTVIVYNKFMSESIFWRFFQKSDLQYSHDTNWLTRAHFWEFLKGELYCHCMQQIE